MSEEEHGAAEPRNVPLWVWGAGLVAYLVFGVIALICFPGPLAELILAQMTKPTSVAEAGVRSASVQAVLLGLGGLLAVITLFVTLQRDGTNRQRLEYEKNKHEQDVRTQHEQLRLLRSAQEAEAEKARNDAENQRVQLELLRTAQEADAEKARTDAENQRKQLEALSDSQALEARKADNDRDTAVTARFTQAIAQLGNEDSVAVRLGGIYSLQRIAADSAKDRLTVLLVLSAFVRENSRAYLDGVADDLNMPLPTDVAAAGFALAQTTKIEGTTDYQVDLHGVDLHEADLKSACFPGGQLNRSDLARANLKDASLRNADFSKSFLRSTKFLDADLTGASFWEVNAPNASFEGANLRGAGFYGAHLDGVNFKKADLRGAHFWGADLADANLEGAQLDGVDFNGFGDATGWSEAQFEMAGSWDESTEWPDGYTPSAPVRRYQVGP